MASPVVHFEIHAEDPKRAQAFYRQVFGWSSNEMPGSDQGYWLLSTSGKGADEIGDAPAEGIDGGMMIRQGPPPSDGAPMNGYVCVVQIEGRIEMTEASIITSGGQVVVPIQEITGVGRTLYAKDTEGNIFGVLEPAPSQSTGQVLEVV